MVLYLLAISTVHVYKLIIIKMLKLWLPVEIDNDPISHIKYLIQISLIGSNDLPSTME